MGRCATDTVYGQAVRPGRQESVDEVYRLKGRSYGRPLPVMVEPVDLEGLGVLVNEPARRLLESDLVPGALTLALGFSEGRSRPEWLDGRDENAVRMTGCLADARPGAVVRPAAGDERQLH